MTNLDEHAKTTEEKVRILFDNGQFKDNVVPSEDAIKLGIICYDYRTKEAEQREKEININWSNVFNEFKRKIRLEEEDLIKQAIKQERERIAKKIDFIIKIEEQKLNLTSKMYYILNNLDDLVDDLNSQSSSDKSSETSKVSGMLTIKSTDKEMKE